MLSLTTSATGNKGPLVPEEDRRRRKNNVYDMKKGEKRRRSRKKSRLTVSDNLCNKGHQPVLVPGSAFRQLAQGCQHLIRLTRANHLCATQQSTLSGKRGGATP